MTIRDAVEDYVKRNHITKDAFAAEAGISRTAFFAKMRGQFSFTLGEAYAMSRMLGCTMDEFYLMTQAQQATGSAR